VLCHSLVLGYTDFSFVRASSILIVGANGMLRQAKQLNSEVFLTKVALDW
jgi:hypothetical protein